MKKAILFDLDGTLWDSVPQLLEVYNEVLSRHPEAGHLLTLEEMRSFMGKNRAALAAAVFPDVSPEAADELVGECFDKEMDVLAVHHAAPFSHLKETLTKLSQTYTLAVVSNCQRGYIELFFDTMGAGEYFTDHECAETGLSKGENIRLVMERNGLEKAFYIGDTQGDMEAADVAGIPFVHAAYGFGKPDRETLAIHDLSQLPPLAENLLN